MARQLSLLKTVLLFSLAGIGICSGADDDKAVAPSSMPSLRASAVIVQPYDITPYEGKSREELMTLIPGHIRHPFRNPAQEPCVDLESPPPLLPFTDGGEYVRESCASPFVDPEWNIVSTIYQTLFRRDDSSDSGINWFFAGMRQAIHRLDVDLDRGKSHYPNPRITLFFYWKQAAWVHPNDAEALAYALQHGFQGKIDINPDWATYWAARSKLLRESPGWYIPNPGGSNLPLGVETEISRFYQFVQQQKPK